MDQASEQQESFARRPEVFLPDKALTRSKVLFNPQKDAWSYQDGVVSVYLDFGRIPSPFAGLVTALKGALLPFAQNNSPAYLVNLFETFLHFSRNVDQRLPEGNLLTLPHIWQYIERLQPKDQYRVGVLNVLFQKWFSLGLQGLAENLVDFLRERRTPGNTKGERVRTHNPTNGAFTEFEYVALYRSIDAAYSSGILEDWAFVLSRLLFATGQRISQYASLKLCDFVVQTSKDGVDRYSIQMPLVKRRHAHSREEFKTYDLSPQTGKVVSKYVRNKAATSEEGFNAPMFSFEGHGNGQGIFQGHCTAKKLSQRLIDELRCIAPTTSRLDGKPMPVSAQRFRYTFGTRMAEEGCSMVIVADRLGHTDLQNVGVYFEASPKIVENIDKALDKYLVPIAEAFRGNVIADEDHASKKGTLGSRIYDFKSAKTSIGSCGKDSGCEFSKPVACYTCIKFEPWLDAPHEKLLDALLNEREKYLASGDERMAVINDNTIIAIREVISICEQIRAQQRGLAEK